MKLGILTAMDKERACIASVLNKATSKIVCDTEYTTGKCGKNTIILAASGIGKVNAALGAEALIRLYKPDALLSTGIAGGIDKKLNIMDAVAGSAYIYHDVWCGKPNKKGQIQGLPAKFFAAEKLLRVVKKISPKTSANEQKIYQGLIVSGDKFIEDKQDMLAIKKSFHNALAVDMESAALAQVCFIKDIPFISFRIISDVPSKNHSKKYENFWASLAEKSFEITKLFLNALE